MEVDNHQPSQLAGEWVGGHNDPIAYIFSLHTFFFSGKGEKMPWAFSESNWHRHKQEQWRKLTKTSKIPKNCTFCFVGGGGEGGEGVTCYIVNQPLQFSINDPYWSFLDSGWYLQIEKWVAWLQKWPKLTINLENKWKNLTFYYGKGPSSCYIGNQTLYFY